MQSFKSRRPSFCTLLHLVFLSVLGWSAAYAQPVNDNCSGAIELPVGGSCVFQTFSNVGATASPNVPVPDCPFGTIYSGGDIWFKMLVPANGRLIVDTEADVIGDGAMALYSGTCNNLVQVVCNDDKSATNTMPKIDQTGLTPGSTVYIRFFDNSNTTFGNFKICAHSPGGGPTEIKDMAVEQVIMPPNGCVLPTQQTVKVRLKNNGNTAQSNFQVAFTVNGGAQVTETVTNSVAPSAQLEYQFTAKANVPVSVNAYTIAASVTQTGDQNTANNTANTSFSNRPLPDAQTVSQVTSCQGSPALLSSYGPAGAQYLWSNGGQGASISVAPNTNTTYRVTVTDAFGCSDVDTVTVTIAALPVQPVVSFSSLQLCAGGTVTLTSSIATNIVWSTGATTASITVSQAGNYFVKHVGPTGCERASATVSIQQVAPPSLATLGVGAVCPGGTETLLVNHPGGFSYQYLWSNGATTQSIQVMPIDTTLYSATVTNLTLNCQYQLQKTIFTISNAPPGPITAMQPANGTQNLPLPLTLSWLPASNASHYNLYVWRNGDPEPNINNPTVTNITALNYTFYSGLQYNTTYNWRLLPKTPCNTGVQGPTQSFKLAQLPNLVIDEITVPTGAIFSGAQANFAWKTKNIGLGNTFQPNWYDVVILSQDSTCATPNDDQLLGAKVNVSALVPQAAYTSTLTYPVPEGTDGKRYVLVVADGYGGSPNETSETDNCRVASTTLMLQLTPPPDLRVKANTAVLPGVAGIVQAGTTGTLQWDTENKGLGKNNHGGWWDRAYLSADTVLNTFGDIYLGAVGFDTVLQVGQQVRATLQCPFSEDLPGGTYYLFVQVDAYNDEYEHNFEFNNIRRVGSVNVIALPRPDFQVAAAPVLPAVVDIGQQITVQWQVGNIGAGYTGNLTDEIRIATDAAMTNVVAVLGNLSQSANLNTGATQTRQKIVQIPGNLSGNYFVAVRTDAYNTVNEGGQEQNNLSPATPLQIRAANLVMQTVEPAVNTVVAGQTVAINWTVRNSGNGNLINAAITDGFRLSPNANGSGGFGLGNYTASVSIFSGNTTNRQQLFTIPLTTAPGDYYVVGRTNTAQLPVEGGQFGDNEKVSVGKLTVTAASFPDLTPTSPSIQPNIVETGSTVSLVCTISNQGQSAVQGAWTDQIYLSASSTWGSGGQLLKSVQHAQLLAAGQNYALQTTVTIPQGLPSGQYYIYVVTDAQNAVLELNAEQNNVSTGVLLTINNTVDANLNLYDLAVSANLSPGATGTIQWKVRNNGTTATLPTGWTDQLVLSQDLLYSNDDVPIGTWVRSFALGAGQSYARTETFQIPTTPSNNFYLILVADSDTLSGDSYFDDNIQVLMDAGGTGGGPIVITFPPKADLQVQSVSTAPSVQSGQSTKVYYTVKNVGATVASGTVTDGLFRSDDLTLNSGDALLSSKQRTLNLAPNGTYSDSLVANFMGSDSGGIILLLRANLNNALPEEVLLNNVGNTFTVVQPPPPGDLVVQQLLAPVQVLSGAEVQATWQTRNQGANPITGVFTEQLFWSKDSIWDANDLLWGTQQTFVAMPPNGVQSRSYTAQLSGLADGHYWLLARTDAYNQFVEANETNNTAVSPFQVQFEVPVLPIAVTTPAVLPLEEMLYYRIQVPANLAGQMLAVQLRGAQGNGIFNELYLRYGDVPTRTAYDYAFDQPFVSDQLVYIPVLAAGDYYLGAYALDGVAAQNITLRADIVPYSITAVFANKGGNTGRVTVQVKGTKLASTDQFVLKNNSGVEISGTVLPGVNLFSAYVRFDLNNAPLGLYDVVAQHSPTEKDTLPQSFEVVAGSVGNTAPQLTCAFGANAPLVLNGLEPVGFEVQHPPSARPNQVIPLVFRMENTGNVDIPIPQKILSSVGGAPIALDQGTLPQLPQEVNLQFVEDGGPTDVLRPGGVVFKTVYAKAIRLLQFNIY